MFSIISAPPGDNRKLLFAPCSGGVLFWVYLFGKEEHLLRVTPEPHCWIGWGKFVRSSTTFTPTQPPTAPCLSFSFQQQSASSDLLESPSRLPSTAHLAVRINWLSWGVWPSTFPRWQLEDGVKLYSSLKQATFRSLFFFLNLIIRGNQAGIKRVIHWTLREKQKQKNKKTNLLQLNASLHNTPKHSTFSYITIKKLQCPVQTTLQGKLMVYIWRMEWTKCSLLLHPEYNKPAGRDLRPQFPVCTTFTCYTIARHNWWVQLADPRRPVLLAKPFRSRADRLTQRQTLWGHSSCSLQVPRGASRWKGFYFGGVGLWTAKKRMLPVACTPRLTKNPKPHETWTCKRTQSQTIKRDA